MARRLCTGDRRQRGPALLATRTTPVPSIQRHAVVGGRIHSAPAPLCVRLRLDPAPPLIGFGVQPGHHDCGGTGGERDMKVSGARRQARDPTVHEPRETHAHGTADPTA